MSSLDCSIYTNPCNKAIELHNDKILLQKNISKAKKCCDNDEYKELSEIFLKFTKDESKTNLGTLKILLEVLQYYYKRKKLQNLNYNLPFRLFVDKFPRDNSLEWQNFKKQHVFEALCKILLILNYDNNYYGKNKDFYRSLEEHSKYISKSINKPELFNSNINEGSSAGSVDIFFKTSKRASKPKNLFSCEDDLCKDDSNLEGCSKTNKDLYVLIQNKYYDKEKSDISKYDVPKIAQRANTIFKSKKDIGENYKIVLMVNDEQVLDSKLKEMDKTNLDIIGIDKLDGWFQKLLFDLFETKFERIDDFIGLEQNTANSIQPRFHQKLFIDTTMKYINSKDTKRQKFIWGAVPRSGKSYIIGGMIAQRGQTNNNDILLVLGAKTETESQFRELFTEKYIDFNEYGYIGPGEKENPSNTKSKNIYVISQELLKVNNKNKLSHSDSRELKQLKTKQNNRETLSNIEIDKIKELESKQKILSNKVFEFDDSVKSRYKKLFHKKNIDLYFDEIHSGGSTNKSKDILNALQFDKFVIDIFVMVSATFAKPSIIYDDFLENQSPIVLQWTYGDQQLMKNINTNSINLDMVRSNHSNKYELETFDELLLEYNTRYGDEYLRILAEEYHKHPELVLINPETMDDYFSKMDITDDILKLQCSAIDYNKEALLRNPDNIFEHKSKVEKLLNIIGSYKSDIDKSINEKSLYGYMHSQGIDLFENFQRTHLWFLPVSNLYNTDTKDPNCQIKGRKPYKKDVDETDRAPDENTIKNKDGRPHIEPLFRGLALLMMQNSFYREHFHILLVHNDSDLYKLTNDKFINVNCICDKKDKFYKEPLVHKIKEFEYKAKQDKKGLIILVGSMLRLGVSLPCADIALNFDNINSVDSNYQTMFRVLTERKDKKYGYYVDFNKNRCINFVYEYNQIYTSNLKKSSTMKELQDNVKNILQLFNFNNISFNPSTNFKEIIGIYDKLYNSLELDSEKFKQRYLTDFGKNFGKNLLKLSDMSIFKDFNKEFGYNFKDSTSIKKNLTEKIKKNKSKKVRIPHPHGATKNDPGNSPISDDSNDESEEELEEEESPNKTIKNLRVLIPTLVFLLAFFNNKKNFNCNTLEECLNNSIKKIDGFHSHLCDCSDSNEKDLHPIACYLKKINNVWSKKTILKNFLIKFRDLFFSEENHTRHIEQRNALIVYFDNIKDSFSGNKSTSNIKTMKSSNTSRNNSMNNSRNNSKTKKNNVYNISNTELVTQHILADEFKKTPNSLKGGGKGADPLIFHMSPENIQQKIEEYLPIRSEFKDKFGEVFTPPELIYEMLNKLEEIDPKIYKNPNLKWLYPANGIGNFPMIAYIKLMDGLKSNIPDKKKRSEHIIKNMLYMVELNEDNILISKRIFGTHANIFCGSFLPEKDEVNPKWVGYFKDKLSGKIIDKFDIIMGNPPYNETDTGRRGKKHLDNEFILYSIEKIKIDGYLNFITKTGWRSIYIGGKENKILKNIKEWSLLYSKIFDFNQNPFNANVLTNIFILKNKNIKKQTEFLLNNEQIYGKIPNNMNLYFLPRKYLKVLYDLKKEYGDLSYITRGIPTSSNYLLISHRTGEILTKLPSSAKTDEYYIIENPNSLMIDFFKNIFKDMRYIGRFTGFATSKTLFYDIPNFNKIKETKYLKKDFWKEFVDDDGNPRKSNSNLNSSKRTKKNNNNNNNNNNNRARKSNTEKSKPKTKSKFKNISKTHTPKPRNTTKSTPTRKLSSGMASKKVNTIKNNAKKIRKQLELEKLEREAKRIIEYQEYQEQQQKNNIKSKKPNTKKYGIRNTDKNGIPRKGSIFDKNGNKSKDKKTKEGECVFPFKFHRKDRDACITSKGKEGLWCATNIDDEGNIINWGYCE